MISALALLAAISGQPIPVGHFDTVELNGGGIVTMREGPVQQVTILRGSPEYTDIHVEPNGSRQRLVIHACNTRCPETYRLEIEVVTPRLDGLAVNGGGQITAAPGFAPSQELAAAVHGGGVIDLRAAPARDVAAAVNGGGLIRVSASRDLTAAVNGGGEIRYWGNPSVTSAVHGGGRVVRGE